MSFVMSQRWLVSVWRQKNIKISWDLHMCSRSLDEDCMRITLNSNSNLSWLAECDQCICKRGPSQMPRDAHQEGPLSIFLAQWNPLACLLPPLFPSPIRDCALSSVGFCSSAKLTWLPPWQCVPQFSHHPERKLWIIENLSHHFTLIDFSQFH